MQTNNVLLPVRFSIVAEAGCFRISKGWSHYELYNSPTHVAPSTKKWLRSCEWSNIMRNQMVTRTSFRLVSEEPLRRKVR
jgi:hypothetical protein